MVNNIKKVLVVGGAGYIGGVVTDILMERKIPFTVYDNLLYTHQYLKPVDFIYGDIRDTQKLAAILPVYSHVVWLAAIVGDAACQIKPDLTVAINQEPVKWLAQNYDGRIIFLSTCSVYGQREGLVDETSPVNPLSLYAKTKLTAESYLQKENHLIFRLGTAFGVSDYHSRLRMDLVVNYMTASALTKGCLSVFGGAQWRPLIHVKDISQVIADNLESPARGIYNLTTANLQIRELAQIISDFSGCRVKYTEQKFEDQRNYRASSKKALSTGVSKLDRVRSIESGIGEISNLISSGRVKYVDNDIYSNERHLAGLSKNGQFI